jgi:hypothetical protein
MPVATKIASVPARLTVASSRVRRTGETARKAAKAGYVAGRTLERRRKAGSSAGSNAPSPTLFAVGAAAGAGAGYFLDPQHGKRRRHVARDRILAVARRGAGEAELNDPALAQKVESEIFRPADAPKGEVNVNVENGVVVLRGQVEDSNQADALVVAASQVEGVRDVESKLTVG